MQCLFLDLASHGSAPLTANSDVPSQGASIACVSDSKTESIAYVDHRMTDDRLMPTLEETLKKAQWTYKDLTHIACITGPGGFTSLRMAVTLADVLADQLQIPSVGIHLSDLYAARAASPFVWMHSTKKTHLFIRTFGIDTSPYTDPTLVSLEELTPHASLLTPYAGELIPLHREALAEKHLRAASLTPLEDTLPAFLASQTYGKELIVPWYGRGW